MTPGSEVTYHWNPAVTGITFSNQKTESPCLGWQTIGLSAPGPEIISDSSGLIPWSKRKFQLFPLWHFNLYFSPFHYFLWGRSLGTLATENRIDLLTFFAALEVRKGEGREASYFPFRVSERGTWQGSLSCPGNRNPRSYSLCFLLGHRLGIIIARVENHIGHLLHCKGRTGVGDSMWGPPRTCTAPAGDAVNCWSVLLRLGFMAGVSEFCPQATPVCQ